MVFFQVLQTIETTYHMWEHRNHQPKHSFLSECGYSKVFDPGTENLAHEGNHELVYASQTTNVQPHMSECGNSQKQPGKQLPVVLSSHEIYFY